MTDRLTVDQINSDQLDQLYDRVATAEQEADTSVAAAAHLATLVGKRSDRTEKAAKAQRQRADIAETELRTLRSGLRANGADPTQIQNLWAQISLRNRQWREEKQRAAQTETERDGAYRERARLVALLAALYPSHIGYTDPAAIDWLVVTIETPTGQMSWHIAERDRDLFEHVKLVPAVHNTWDGHSTEEKYRRLRELTRITPGLPWMPSAEPGHVVPVEGNPAAAQEAIRQMDADMTEPHTGLVVQPYRDHGQEKWVFRCWGTDDGCDGLLSLDHTSQQSAEHARDRHVTENHTSEEQR